MALSETQHFTFYFTTSEGWAGSPPKFNQLFLVSLPSYPDQNPLRTCWIMLLTDGQSENITSSVEVINQVNWALIRWAAVWPTNSNSEQLWLDKDRSRGSPNQVTQLSITAKLTQSTVLTKIDTPGKTCNHNQPDRYKSETINQQPQSCSCCNYTIIQLQAQYFTTTAINNCNIIWWIQLIQQNIYIYNTIKLSSQLTRRCRISYEMVAT